DVSNQFQKLPNDQILLQLSTTTLTPNVVYDLHIVAVSLDNKQVVKDLNFGIGYKANADQKIDDVLLGDDSDDGTGRANNAAALDRSGGNLSSLVLPPGALLPVSSAAIPACTFTSNDVNSSTVAAAVNAISSGAITSDVYSLSLSSVSINPDK